MAFSGRASVGCVGGELLDAILASDTTLCESVCRLVVEYSMPRLVLIGRRTIPGPAYTRAVDRITVFECPVPAFSSQLHVGDSEWKDMTSAYVPYEGKLYVTLSTNNGLVAIGDGELPIRLQSLSHAGHETNEAAGPRISKLHSILNLGDMDHDSGYYKNPGGVNLSPERERVAVYRDLVVKSNLAGVTVLAKDIGHIHGWPDQIVVLQYGEPPCRPVPVGVDSVAIVPSPILQRLMSQLGYTSLYIGQFSVVTFCKCDDMLYYETRAPRTRNVVYTLHVAHSGKPATYTAFWPQFDNLWEVPPSPRHMWADDTLCVLFSAQVAGCGLEVASADKTSGCIVWKTVPLPPLPDGVTSARIIGSF